MEQILTQMAKGKRLVDVVVKVVSVAGLRTVSQYLSCKADHMERGRLVQVTKVSIKMPEYKESEIPEIRFLLNNLRV
jgi:hypothetical protein